MNDTGAGFHEKNNGVLLALALMLLLPWLQLHHGYKVASNFPSVDKLCVSACLNNKPFGAETIFILASCTALNTMCVLNEDKYVIVALSIP